MLEVAKTKTNKATFKGLWTRMIDKDKLMNSRRSMIKAKRMNRIWINSLYFPKSHQSTAKTFKAIMKYVESLSNLLSCSTKILGRKTPTPRSLWEDRRRKSRVLICKRPWKSYPLIFDLYFPHPIYHIHPKNIWASSYSNSPINLVYNTQLYLYFNLSNKWQTSIYT